ncbi:MAG: TraX family protein [Eubacteriales bacterium]|nr:TraX family protein [Eubacteriales bacterium]
MKEMTVNTDFAFSRNALKLLAILTMTGNHAAHVFLSPQSILYTICINAGYFTAITMCYFLAEGFFYTRSVRRYALRLLVFAVISQIPYHVLWKESKVEAAPLNMLFSLLICLLCLVIISSIQLSIASRSILLMALGAVSFLCDWSIMAPLFTLSFWNAMQTKTGDRNGRRWLIFPYISSIAVFILLETLEAGILNAVFASAGLWLSMLLILRGYNGKKGRHATFFKWFFYGYYPVHLIVLYVLLKIQQGF